LDSVSIGWMQDAFELRALDGLGHALGALGPVEAADGADEIQERGRRHVRIRRVPLRADSRSSLAAIGSASTSKPHTRRSRRWAPGTR